MTSRGEILFIVGSFAMLSGCVSPLTTRLPTWMPGDPYIERQAALTKDPYPNSDFGPDVSFRPADYQNPRSEARSAKEKFFTWAKPQLTPSDPDPSTSTSWILPPPMGTSIPAAPHAAPARRPHSAPAVAPGPIAGGYALPGY